MLLHEKEIAIITGAGSGIGRTIAITYARHGAQVILFDKDKDGLKETIRLLGAASNDCCYYCVDMTSESEISAAVLDVFERFGRINILINNAGLGKTVSMFDLSLDDWDYIINTNLRGTFIASREAAKIMRLNDGGSIVNIASTRALMSEADTEAYSASKGGILALTHAMAVSLGPDRITVNAISPGWIETKDYGKLSSEDHNQHPVRRVGRPEDVALACIYLTYPENDFITGTNLVIDGGMTRKMIYAD